MNYFSSLNLSKKLKEGGCELESKEFYHDDKCRYCIDDQVFGSFIISDYPKAYHILEDICVRYADKFFGEDITIMLECEPDGSTPEEVEYFKYELCSNNILYMLQRGESQEKIEEYIWEHCLFNKKEK